MGESSRGKKTTSDGLFSPPGRKRPKRAGLDGGGCRKNSRGASQRGYFFRAGEGQKQKKGGDGKLPIGKPIYRARGEKYLFLHAKEAGYAGKICETTEAAPGRKEGGVNRRKESPVSRGESYAAERGRG